jgi:hypothetical protein
MPDPLYRSTRQFRVFDYSPSHSQLLIRSSINKDYQTNIDIIFFGVEYIQINLFLNGISIDNDSNDTLTNVQNEPSRNDLNRIFKIISENRHYHIEAGFFKVYENTLEFSESSLGLASPMGRENEISSSVE